MYALRLGDDDATNQWGGSPHPGDPPGTFVKDLQDQLRALGFGLLTFRKDQSGDPDGHFGYWTAFAVREFQIYAKAPWAAKDEGRAEGVLAFVPVKKETKQIYAGPLSGVVNDKTRMLIDLWIKEHWLCPLVVCGFSERLATTDGRLADLPAATKALRVPNAWTRFDHVKGAKYYYAIDYSGSIPDAKGNSPDLSSGQPLVDGAGALYPAVKNGSGYETCARLA